MLPVRGNVTERWHSDGRHGPTGQTGVMARKDPYAMVSGLIRKIPSNQLKPVTDPRGGAGGLTPGDVLGGLAVLRFPRNSLVDYPEPPFNNSYIAPDNVNIFFS